MRKKSMKKILLILAFCMLYIIGLNTISMANDYSCNLSLVPDKNEVSEGQKVTISINVSNIVAGNGIAVYNTIIDYDKNSFDIQIEQDTDKRWTNTLIGNSLTFTKADYEATSENQEIGKIVLTVKQGASKEDKTITLKNNEFADNDIFSIDDVGTMIKIIDNNSSDNKPNTDDTDSESTKENGNTESVGNPSYDNEKQNSITKTPTNSSVADKIFPKAGTFQNVLIILITIIVIVAIISVVKYSKLNMGGKTK